MSTIRCVDVILMSMMRCVDDAMQVVEVMSTDASFDFGISEKEHLKICATRYASVPA